MIPKQAIEKAIEGGWQPNPLLSYLERCEGEEAGLFIFEYRITPDRVAHFSLRQEEIALDPTFWQALGKRCGWQYQNDTQYCRGGRGCVKGERELHNPCIWETVEASWMKKAREFYDLILTGQDTEQFWHDIINI